jgi:hypothetical protein
LSLFWEGLLFSVSPSVICLYLCSASF